MCILQQFIEELYHYLLNTSDVNINNCNIIRIHTKKLQQLGDLSFPLNAKNWHNLLKTREIKIENSFTIFDYRNSLENQSFTLEESVELLKNASSNWTVKISKTDFQNEDLHLCLNKGDLMNTCLKAVDSNYGRCRLFDNFINLVTTEVLEDYKICDLSSLRLRLVKDVAMNLIQFCTPMKSNTQIDLNITLNNNKKCKSILIGPILNENNQKDTKTSALDLYNKRSSDMRMMAQHKYGIQVKPKSSWVNYFEKLGRYCVTIEMLSNKPHKPCKLTLNNLEVSNKGASFIFYNCARLAALFKELDKRIAENFYPPMPDINKINFNLLIEPEEWELFFVYILQFPMVIKNCIKDVEKGIVNPQYLITFLSSLSSTFSGYYRRVRILREAKEHLLELLFARVYLLKALQNVFHNALFLLNIEPIKEM